MKKLGIFVITTICILTAFVATAICAAVPTVATGLDSLITDTIQPLIVSVICAIVPLLLALACRWLSKKTGIAISDASQQKLEDIATKAVLCVEEKATASLKTAGEKWPAYMKYQQAIDRVLSLAPSLSHDQADVLVHWAVAKIPGIGSTGVLGATSTEPVPQPAADPAVVSDPPPAAAASPADSFLDLLANMVSSKLSATADPATAPVGDTNGDGTRPVGGIAAAAQ